ncbi:MAG: carbohydrate porin [Alphaproteobacteria bacterium]|nr:carbohydrate porin [Alphaproteobacteria bacterium]
MKKNLIIGTILGTIYATQSYAGAIENNYSNFKNLLNDRYGIEYNLDYSLMLQHASPSGKYNAVQSYFAPSLTWTTFNNQYGTGVLNASYSSVFYGNHNATDIQNRTGMVTPINDETSNEQEFASLYYTYQFPQKYNWLTLGLGQYSLYAFDGTDYDNDQQVNFINYSLSQNGSATYADAGLGAYIQATPQNWNLTIGFQDATNIDAPSIRFNHLDDKHYATFAQIGYNPKIKNLGNGQYSIMLYNQPSVKEQPQTTNGWSFNAQQNIGDKMALFGRINGVSGAVSAIKNSYVAGMVYNNPLNRNNLDQIGIAYSYNDISAKAVGSKLANNGEHVIETYWAWGISKWATLTPDLQFYINPALNEKSDYGTAISLRLSLFF